MATKKEMTYEQAISRLEEIVSILEKNEVSLDEALELFDSERRVIINCFNNIYTELVNTMLSEIRSNDLVAFKKILDDSCIREIYA